MCAKVRETGKREGVTEMIHSCHFMLHVYMKLIYAQLKQGFNMFMNQNFGLKIL